MIDTEQRERIRKELLKEQTRLVAIADGIEEDGLMVALDDSIGELSSYDQHPADVASEVFERSKDLALREDARLKVRAIDDALNKLEQGDYGKCESCGAIIPTERLEVIPYTTRCVQCQSEGEHSPLKGDRPVEEEVLDPAFRRTANDGSDKAIYDGEDAWQEVARWNEHAVGSRAGAYYGDSEMVEDRGYTEEVDSIPYYKEDGIIYSSFHGVDDEQPPLGSE